jgi:hypothetical protein
VGFVAAINYPLQQLSCPIAESSRSVPQSKELLLTHISQALKEPQS